MSGLEDYYAPTDPNTIAGTALQAPGPPGSSWIPAAIRSAARQALPTAGGAAAFPAGAAFGALVAAPLDPFTLGGASLVGGGVGGLAAAFGAGALVDKGQRAAGDALTGGGFSRSQAQDEAEHPLASFLGGVAPQVAFFRPGWSGVKAAIAGGAIGAGSEAGTEYAQTGAIDPLKVGVQGALGATLGTPTRLGELAMAPAHYAVASVAQGGGLTMARVAARSAVDEALRGVEGADETVHRAAIDAADPNMSAGTRADLARIAALRAALGEHLTREEEAAAHVVEADAAVEAANPFVRTPAGIAAHGEAMATATEQLLGDRPVDVAPGRSPSVPAIPDEDWTAAIVHVESRGDPDAVSPKGAKGRMQVMDATNRDPGFGVTPARDDSPAERERVGRDYLHALANHYGGDQVLATAAYNAGPGRVDRWIRLYGDPRTGEISNADWADRIPIAETRSYVRQVFGHLGHDLPDTPVIRPEMAANDDWSALGGDADADLPPYSLDIYRPQDLSVDADMMQFKGGGDAAGVTDRLQGVTQWNPLVAGRVMVWERSDGKRFIVDGHQRLDLANRILAEDPGADIPLHAVTLREADGISAADARAWGAIKNIGEGTGSPIDAAKVVRDRPDLAGLVPPRSPLVRDARALARLSDEAFGAVYNGVIDPEQAAAIGRWLPDHPELHGAMVDLLHKLDPQTRTQADSIVRQAMAAGFTKEQQFDLFGAQDQVNALFLPRARVLEAALRRFARLKRVHATAASAADALEETGSRIARAASEKEAENNGQAADILERLAYRPGPVADALDRAARELAGGERLAAVTQRFADTVRDLDLAELAADVERPGGGGDADAAGRPGGAGGEDEGVSEQPGLEFERAPVPVFDAPGEEPGLSLFDEPVGPAAESQARTLEHDLAAEPALSSPEGGRTDRVLHPRTGETLAAAQARAQALKDSFPAPDGGEPGTGNIGNAADAGDGSGRTRRELRRAIVETMMEGEARRDRVADIVLGPPAAGKSSFAEPLAERRGARIVDSDTAKAMLPEFDDGVGAMAVHVESALLAERVRREAMKRGENIVLPLVGGAQQAIAAKIAELEKAGYSIYLHLVDLPNDKAVERAIARFASTGRLVDPRYVASVGEKPKATFERLVNEPGSKLAGHVHVSNDVPIGTAPELRAESEPGLRDRLVGPGGPGGGDGAAGGGERAGQPLDGGVARPAVPELEASPPEFRLDEEGGLSSLDDVLRAADADDAALAAMRGCLIPPKGDA